MSGPLNFKRITAVGALLTALALSACFQYDNWIGPGSDRPAYVNVSLRVDGVNSLTKTSTISLSKLIVAFTSSVNDTIRDTITSSTSPALSATSTSTQTIAKNYTLKALRTWKLVATVKDSRDSVIHRDSSTTSVLMEADTAHISLNLSSRFAMYQANFIIPDSIASATGGSAKDALHINRLVLKIDGVTRKDSSKTYFTGTSSLAYDYVTNGSHIIQMLAYGHLHYWDTTQALYSGSDTLNVGAGHDSTTSFNMTWVGPTTGTGAITVTLGRAGKLNITGALPGATGLPSTWNTLTSGTANPLYAVFFTDANNGWVVGDSSTTAKRGIIRKTTDGGSTWSAQTSGTTNRLNDVFFSGTSTGWAVGAAGTIITTSNGGGTWSSQTSGTTNSLNGVYFVSSTNGWAVGAAGTIRATTNGGTNWNASTSGTTNPLNSVFFADANTGWVVGDSSTTNRRGIIRKTTNAGSSWTAQTSGTTHALYGAYFTDANTGWAVGDSGAILKTVNGGTNWTAQTCGTNKNLKSVFFTDANTGFVVGLGGTILKTTNGGTNWVTQYLGSSTDLYSVYFESSSIGWAVGATGTILSINP
jgi:photosystem II stability/assembly factor-like uncharacterized protein